MLNTINLASAVAMKADGKTIALKDNWKTFWDSFADTAGIDGILKLLSIVGVLLIAFAFIKWAWDRRRGLNGGGSGAIWGALLIGAILSAPNLLIPIVLTALDAIVNAVANILDKTV